MKKLLLLAILTGITTLFLPTKAFATHGYGGNITYKAVGQDSFLVTVTFFRDCNGIAVATSKPVIKCGNVSLNIDVTAVTPIDVTPACDTSCTRCSNGNCNFPFGIQKHVLSGIVYLGNYANCCNWVIDWTQCCRSSAITTGSANTDFYLSSALNNCLSSPNNSPTPVLNSFQILCSGRCIELDFGMTDPDGDQLKYSLVSPKTSASGNSTYSTPYSYDKPIYFFNFPNTNSNSGCTGFKLDSVTGKLRFSPMTNQISTMAIKVEEFRNGIKIGEIINDIGLIVTSCSGYSPVINTSFSGSVCEGDTAKILFLVSDQDSDSASFSVIRKPEGAYIVYDTTSKLPKGVIILPVPKNKFKTGTLYSFELMTVDNNCPLSLSAFKSLNILVNKNPAASFTVTSNNCREVVFTGFPLDGDQGYSYKWSGSHGLNSNQKITTHKYDSNGTYHFDLSITKNGCTTSFSDSIELLVDYQNITSGLASDTLICYGENVSVNPKGGHEPYNLLILNDSSYSSNLSPSSDTTYFIKIIDALGCSTIDTVNISVIPPVSISAGQDRHFCENAGLQTFSGSPSGGIFTGKGMLDSNRFDPSIAGNNIETIVYTYTDSNGCIYNDSFYVQVNDRPDIFLSNDTTICIGEQLNLDASPTGGMWSGNGLMNNVFDAAIAGVGTHTLTYSYFVTPQCGNSDSFTVTVAPLPVVDAGTDTAICATAKPVLPVSPAGGTWNLPAFNNDTFAAIHAGAGLHTAVYSYTDSLGCTNADTVNIYVSFLQGVSAMADFKVCANERKLNLTGNPAGGQWHGAGVSGSEFNPAAVTAGNYILYYSYVDSTGCTGYDTTIATVAAPPVANFHANPIYGKAPLTVDLSDASTGAINHWQWTVGDTTLYGPSPSVTIADTGYHTITLAITDSLTGCSDTFSRQAYIMVLTNGIFELKESTFSVKVYPSPADNKCFLMIEDLEGMRFRLLLYNLQGNLVQAKDLSGISPYTIDREGLPAGVYLFELVSHKGHKASGKIIFR